MPDGEDRRAALALEGIALPGGWHVAFRSGQSAEGRRLYQQAIQELNRAQFGQGTALAALFLAREELVAGESQEAIALSLKRARDLAKKAGSADVQALLATVDRMASGSAQDTPPHRTGGRSLR